MNEHLNPENSDLSNEEIDVEKKLRPLSFDDFTGQEQALENLKIFVEAANRRGEALDHTLFHGPPGLGKDNLGQHIGKRIECRDQSDLWTCFGQAGRPCGSLDRLGRARCIVYR